MIAPLPWVYDDGGRAVAGFRGATGDCVARAYAIATGRTYAEVYAEIADEQARRGKKRTARTFRLQRPAIDALLAPHGFVWTPTMTIGSGCTVHLGDELLEHARPGMARPTDPIVVRLSRHLTTVVDGVIHDTYDPGRDGTRCVYGYWRKA